MVGVERFRVQRVQRVGLQRVGVQEFPSFLLSKFGLLPSPVFFGHKNHPPAGSKTQGSNISDGTYTVFNSFYSLQVVPTVNVVVICKLSVYYKIVV